MEKLVAESLEELGISEKLKGKQYKIDADKNKKITPNDFKILRGEKKPPKRVNEYDEPEERVPSEVQDTMYRTGKDRWEKRQAQIGSMEQIPVEEFDAFVDTLLDLPFKEAVAQLKAFIDEHPYIHEELGELEGRDKYVGPYEKFVDNFRDEF